MIGRTLFRAETSAQLMGASPVRAYVRDGTSQSELVRLDLERCQRETVRRLEAAVIEAERKDRAEANVDAD